MRNNFSNFQTDVVRYFSSFFFLLSSFLIFAELLAVDFCENPDLLSTKQQLKKREFVTTYKHCSLQPIVSTYSS